jgi:hypothetical protein
MEKTQSEVDSRTGRRKLGLMVGWIATLIWYELLEVSDTAYKGYHTTVLIHYRIE